MQNIDASLRDRVGMDDPGTSPKRGRYRVGGTMTVQERAKIIATLAAANEKFKLSPEK